MKKNSHEKLTKAPAIKNWLLAKTAFAVCLWQCMSIDCCCRGRSKVGPDSPYFTESYSPRGRKSSAWEEVAFKKAKTPRAKPSKENNGCRWWRWRRQVLPMEKIDLNNFSGFGSVPNYKITELRIENRACGDHGYQIEMVGSTDRKFTTRVKDHHQRKAYIFYFKGDSYIREEIDIKDFYKLRDAVAVIE